LASTLEGLQVEVVRLDEDQDGATQGMSAHSEPAGRSKVVLDELTRNRFLMNAGQLDPPIG